MLNAEIVNKDEEIVKFVEALLEKAVREKASDIHIEPKDTYTRVRFRIDGVLHIPEGYENIPKQLHSYIIARIKVLSGLMKLDVNNRPQDGKISMTVDKKKYVFRLITLPTTQGESLSIQIVNEDLISLSIEDMFNNDLDLIEIFKRNITKHDGMILFTGLAGSGKVTIANSVLEYISDIGKKTVTIENPVEKRITNAEQMWVSTNIGCTSEVLTKVALRGDADIIYISELRDYDTALLAFEGAMQGHMIFSTMHTNNAVDALFRCTQMGIKEYLSGSVLQFILNSKLAKRICQHCKEEMDHNKNSLKAIGLTDDEIKNSKFFKGKGCKKCDNTGYAGRVAIMEMLEFTPEIREAFINGADNKEIIKLSRKEGVYHTHKDDALKKFKAGVIDLDTARMFTL